MIDPSQLTRLAACGVIFNDRRETLLILRNDMPLWESPGGIVDEGETHEQAVIREAKEEIGCDTAIKHYLGTIYRKIDDLMLNGYRYFRFYELTMLSREIVLDEHVAFEWFAVDRLPNNLAPLHRLAIHRAYENKPATEEISLMLDGKTFVRTLETPELYGLEQWMMHPKVIAKRATGQMRFDPAQHN